MRNKASFLTIIIYLLLLSALIMRDGDLALMVLPFLVYLLVGVASIPSGVSLAGSRVVTVQNEKNDARILVSVALTNRGPGLNNVLLSDKRFHGTTILTGYGEQRLAIPQGGEAALHYEFRAQRGSYAWESIRVCASDMFGLVSISKDIPAPEEVHIPPERWKLDHISLRPRSTIHSAGSVPTRFGGPGLNFLGIREYRPGDSLRWLNWRRIARQPRRLFTNEFEREEILDIGLILDARMQTEVRSNGRSLFEHSVSAANALAELFLREGNRVGLLIYGQEMTPLRPGYGKRQLQRISNALAGARVRSSFSLIYLESVQKKLFNSRALIVMISPLGLKDLQTYRQLRMYGYQILLLSPDPVSFSARVMPSDRTLDLALRAARIERYALMKRLMHMDVKVVDWQVDRSLNETLQATLSPRPGAQIETHV